MERRIGEILRKARERRELGLDEVEEATRIRLKYLRAIEAEEWDALPEEVYGRAFIRTYASHLGLDGDRLAAEYRDATGAARSQADAEPGRAGRPRSEAAGHGRWPARTATGLAIAGVLLLAAIAIVALPLDEGGGPSSSPPSSAGTGPAPAAQRPPPSPAPSPGVSVRLTARAGIWVCLRDGRGRHLVDGRILEAGAEEGPFRSGSFTVSLGNGEVTMLVDGKRADIAATSSPVGYSIDASGRLTRLSETERPTCA